MRLPKVGMDLDGVVVDFFYPLIEKYNEEHRDSLTVFDIKCELETLGPDKTKKLIKIFNRPGYLKELKPLPGAIDIVKDLLSEEYDITICTAPARDLNGIVNGESAAEKVIWLKKWLPELVNKLIITQHKAMITVDILIDDFTHNIINWCDAHPEGIGFLVHQPWNLEFKSLPVNAVRSSLERLSQFLSTFWCKDREKFIYRYDELAIWKTVNEDSI